jgi:hypothetical protein
MTGMTMYWVLLLCLSVGSIFYQAQHRMIATGSIMTDNGVRASVPLMSAVIVITLMIGLRYRVGGDWEVYAQHFEMISAYPLPIALKRSPDEFGYTLLNWIVGHVGGELWLVNLVCAMPFVAGLTAICRQQPNPWLALVVAAPLLIIVVGMGFTRQASAMGFMLIGMAELARGRNFWSFALWTVVGSLFHQSVLVLLPMVALILFRGTALSLLLLVAVVFIGYFVLLPHALERYSAGYITAVYQAKGALFRIGPNALAAVILLGFRRQYEGPPIELKIWRGWAILALFIFGAFFYIKSSVILDRLSLYVLPLQIYVFGRLPTAFGVQRRPSLSLTVLVIGYSAMVLFLWLTFANHAQYWVPYRIYPLT